MRLAARSLGALRTRFDQALLAGNDVEAERLCDEILATERLNWDNRLYLRVRLRAGLGQWSHIAGDAALLREAQDLQLPPKFGPRSSKPSTGHISIRWRILTIPMQR